MHYWDQELKGEIRGDNSAFLKDLPDYFVLLLIEK